MCTACVGFTSCQTPTQTASGRQTIDPRGNRDALIANLKCSLDQSRRYPAALSWINTAGQVPPQSLFPRWKPVGQSRQYNLRSHCSLHRLDSDNRCCSAESTHCDGPISVNRVCCSDKGRLLHPAIGQPAAESSVPPAPALQGPDRRRQHFLSVGGDRWCRCCAEATAGHSPPTGE